MEVFKSGCDLCSSKYISSLVNCNTFNHQIIKRHQASQKATVQSWFIYANSRDAVVFRRYLNSENGNSHINPMEVFVAFIWKESKEETEEIKYQLEQPVHYQDYKTLFTSRFLLEISIINVKLQLTLDQVQNSTEAKITRITYTLFRQIPAVTWQCSHLHLSPTILWA